jgi:hypothetical protein
VAEWGNVVVQDLTALPAPKPMNTALLLYPALAKKPVSDPADLAHLLLDGMNNPSENTWLNSTWAASKRLSI